MCTSLIYRDAHGKAYVGRTLELIIDLPYQVTYLPAGSVNVSEIAGHRPLKYTSRYAVLAITMPARVPTADAPISISDLKVIEGLNDRGLTFSVLSYPSAAGTSQSVPATQSALAASDLGSWVLGQFGSVAEVKAALDEQPVLLEPLAILRGAMSPFHYVVNDAAGESIVIEFERGQMSVYDNPVGVLTNGPQFSWHLTNLNNYTFLSNVDKSTARFGGYRAVQPDSGVATAGLPASNTSVGRFVRAVYYSQFTEKAASPDMAVRTLSHIMNNFDRPRGVTIDYPQAGGGHLEVEGLDQPDAEDYATEFTSWTSLSDLGRKLFFLRDYESMNFACFDLEALATLQEARAIPLPRLNSAAMDASDLLRGAPIT